MTGMETFVHYYRNISNEKLQDIAIHLAQELDRIEDEYWKSDSKETRKGISKYYRTVSDELRFTQCLLDCRRDG